MSTLASVVEGIERDVLAYTRLAEEARRVIEAATRPSRELAQPLGRRAVASHRPRVRDQLLRGRVVPG